MKYMPGKGIKILGLVGLLLIVAVSCGQVDGTGEERSQTTTSPTPMRLAVGVVGGKVYAIGGRYGMHGRYYLGTVEEYDPTMNKWTTRASMPAGRTGFGVGVVNNRIYAIGGRNSMYDSYYLSTVEEYDPTMNKWTTKASMPTARSGLVVGVVNNKVYAIGGSPGALTTVEEYDPLTNQWTAKSPMRTVRSGFVVGVVNDKIYVIERRDDSGRLSAVDEYDPAADKWTTKASMPTSRVMLAVGVAEDKVYAIYAAGGYNDNYLLMTEEETLLPWNNPPAADAGPDRTAIVGASINFNGSGSDYEGDALSFAWNFDYQDGIFTQDATGQSASHTYTSAGTYAVVLEVTDSEGEWNRDGLEVVVSQP